MDLERHESETALNYHKRLVFGKLVDKTLADADYSELAEKLYGKPYSSDVARRMCYGSLKTLQLIDMENYSSAPQDTVAEIDAKIDELRRESQRFYDQRREYKRLVSKDGRLENLYDALVESADNLNKSIGSLDFFKYRDIETSDEGNEAVLVFSDWHYGMVSSGVFNEYNTDICIERVASVVQEARERIVRHGCKKLHIAILGDMIHGSIHVSARVASEELVCDQLMQISEILAQAICELSRCVPETIIYMTYGNHARAIPKKEDNIHRDNFERIIPWWLEQRLSSDDTIKFAEQTGNEFLFMDVCGHEFCASHGDLDNVHNSPRLLGTLFQKVYGKNIEYILLGDKHHRESFDELGITAMLCGSLCGCDEYANNKRLFSSPSQILLIVNERCGVDAEYRLKC